MPCYDYRDDEERINTQKQNDRLTRMLCWLCNQVDRNNQEKLMMNNPELKRWWVKHQELDRKHKKQQR